MSADAVKVRFRVAAALTRSPQGKRVIVSSETWSGAFQQAFHGLVVNVPDRLGADSERSFVLSPKVLSDLTLAGVVKNEKTLQSLLDHAKKTPGADPESWLSHVAQLTGSGRLLQACRAALASQAAPIASAPAIDSEDPVEALFARAEVAKTTSKSAIDSFVGSLRSGSPAASTVATASARKVRDVVEDAVYQTARDILTAPNVAGLESVWRSLRWFTEQCPAAAGIQLEVLDCTSDSAFQAMEGVSVEEDFAEPDLFALVDGPGESAWSEVALFAENRMAPCLMGLPSTLGALDGDALIEYLSAPTGSESDERLALRADEGSRWLAIAHNPIVMFQEGAGALQRFVLASPVWGILGALGASYASTGSFARITGQPGQLRVPGMHTLSSGKENGVGIPTLHFTSIRAQTELAALGVIGIGSPRNSDRIALAAVPQYRNSRDALLPAQIWTGRIVRFAKWVQGQLPAGSSSEEAREIFEQAGAVFLYPGTGQAAKITAEISGEGEARMLNIGARMDGSLALIPLQIEFSLPLR